MKSLLLALSLFIAAGCSPSVYTPKAELSLEAIQTADEMGSDSQSMVKFGLLDPPDQEWIDRISAYYLALNVAWARGDEAEMDYFFGKLEGLYRQLLEDNVNEDFEIPPESSGQEL